MTRIAMLLLLSLLCVGCGQTPPPAELKFDSAHAIGLEATFSAGRMVSTTTDRETLVSEIRQQLMYTIGNLNGRNGGPDMNRLQISIGQVAARSDGLFDVAYAAQLFLAWPRETAIPQSFEFVLPARGDLSGRRAFFAAYGADEDSGSACLDWSAHDVTVGIFWYYFRPEKRSCPLVDIRRDDPLLVVRLRAQLAVSGQNTSGKFPEYGKIWEDGRLVVTAIFGKNEAGGIGSDAGVIAYVQMYNSLLSSYGRPTTTNLPAGQYPSAANDDVRLTFRSALGDLDVHLYLVDSIRSVGADFVAKYNRRTQVSDMVSYSGHSGLGANIRALAGMGVFSPGQYQIFLINGCDTFAYVDHALRDAHQAANPESGPDKYFDIITNAMPSYFHFNARSNAVLIAGLMGQQMTYRQILAGFDSLQRAAVDGESDNAWPAPFL